MRQKSAVIVLTTLAVLLFTSAVAPAQTFTTLHQFCFGEVYFCLDGAHPSAGLIGDPAGNLYGTTPTGGFGPDGPGVVYKLDTAGKETVLHLFCALTPTCEDGAYPYTPLARDEAGNLYGTTYGGGTAGRGVVFKIDTTGNETVLHSFTCGSDGCQAAQGLVVDESGNLYGTTSIFGAYGYGTIFKVDSAGKFTLLHSFAGGSSDGATPSNGHLILDKSGNLYGVTTQGGNIFQCYEGCGVLYKLSASGTFTVLHSFKGNSVTSGDGCYPYGSVFEDKAGNLYGTTSACGLYGSGTIWELNQRGQETVRHHFYSEHTGSCTMAGVTGDAEGNLYGVTHGAYCGNYIGTFYKLGPKGRLTTLRSFGDGNGSDGEVLRSNDGTLYGITVNGGFDCSGYGCGTVWSYAP